MKRIINIILLILLMPLCAMSQTSKGNGTQLMAEANRLFESGEYKQAKDKYSDVYLDYGNQEALDRVDICTECLNLLSKAMSFEREDNYTSAIDSYQSILRLNSKDPNVAKYIASCKKKQYQPMLDKAHSLYREGNYRQAQSNLNQYIFSTGVNDEGLSNSIAKCINLLTLAETAYNNKNYTQAENYYNQIIQINPTDAKSTKAVANIRRLTSETINSSRGASTASIVKYNIGGKSPKGYTICYLDESGQHGWEMEVNEHGTCQHQISGVHGEWRVPSCEELNVIYYNRYTLGLNGRYWTSTRSKKVANWEFFYTLDFGTGKFKSTDQYKDFPSIIIRNF